MKLDPKIEEKRNRVLHAMAKRDFKALEMALEDFEKFLKAGKYDPKENQLISLAHSQIEQLKLRESVNLILAFLVNIICEGKL